MNSTALLNYPNAATSMRAGTGGAARNRLRKGRPKALEAHLHYITIGKLNSFAEAETIGSEVIGGALRSKQGSSFLRRLLPGTMSGLPVDSECHREEEIIREIANAT